MDKKHKTSVVTNLVIHSDLAAKATTDQTVLYQVTARDAASSDPSNFAEYRFAGWRFHS